jgi:hypothetical protein
MRTLIDFSKWPRYFVTDSIERYIFKPKSATHATVAQVQELVDDAEFYIDPSGPGCCPNGLKQSARAVLKHARAAIAKATTA